MQQRAVASTYIYISFWPPEVVCVVTSHGKALMFARHSRFAFLCFLRDFFLFGNWPSQDPAIIFHHNITRRPLFLRRLRISWECLTTSAVGSSPGITAIPPPHYHRFDSQMNAILIRFAHFFRMRWMCPKLQKEGGTVDSSVSISNQSLVRGSTAQTPPSPYSSLPPFMYPKIFLLVISFSFWEGGREER